MFRTAQLWCLAAALFVAVSCGSSTTPAAPDGGTTTAARTIVVLGDSLAVSPTRSQNFATELQSRLDATPRGWVIENAGVSSDTSTDGLRRIDQALTRDTAILILELGANDGLRGVPIVTVEQNLAALIERAQQRGVRVLLCGMETPPLNGFSYSVEFHGVFPRLAERYRVPLVPFLLAGVALNPDLNGSDEIHPNATGARLIADTVWRYLEPMVQQPSIARRAAGSTHDTAVIAPS